MTVLSRLSRVFSQIGVSGDEELVGTSAAAETRVN